MCRASQNLEDYRCVNGNASCRLLDFFIIYPDFKLVKAEHKFDSGSADLATLAHSCVLGVGGPQWRLVGRPAERLAARLPVVHGSIVCVSKLMKMASGVRGLIAAAISTARKEDPQALYWSTYYPCNFGEMIGPFLYQRITGREAWFSLPSDYSRSSVYVTVGSILGASRRNAIVWGSGVLRTDQEFTRPWRTHAVRGPFSWRAYRRQGYRCPEVFGDPAILLPMVYKPEAPPKRYDIGLVPHFRDLRCARARLTQDLAERVAIVDVRQPIEDVVEKIRMCKRIASSSLHGLVVAHAYGVPAQWVNLGHVSGDGVKYQDYFHSVGIADARPVPLADESGAFGVVLARAVEEAPLPSMSQLQIPLLDACPYIDDSTRRSLIRDEGCLNRSELLG